MFNWIKSLNKTEKRTLYACSGGWALDALDTQLYSFLIPTLIAAWNMTRAEAGLLGTSALMSSAIGGWVAGILCDRIGRVRVMQLTIAWFAFFTVLSGCAQNYEQLFAARVLAGLGFGGEWAAGSVLMGEVIRAEYRGKAVGFVQSAYAIGYAVAALMSSLLFSQLPDSIAWRAMFWIGAAPAVFVFLIRRGTPEPDVYLAAKKKALKEKGRANVNPLAIFHPDVLRITALTSLLAIGIQGGGFALPFWLPTYLKTVHNLSTVTVGYFMFAFTTGSFFGYLSAAYLSDAIGRKRNFLFFVLLNWLTIPLFFYLPISSPVAIVILLFLAGFACLGAYAAVGPYFTELFPTRIRANGQGFSYNVGRAVGALFPTIIGLLSSQGHLELREAITIMGMGAYICVLAALMLLPETQGRDLYTVGEDDPAGGPASTGEQMVKTDAKLQT